MITPVLQRSDWVAPGNWFPSVSWLRPWILVIGCLGMMMLTSLPLVLRSRSPDADWFEAQARFGLLLEALILVRVCFSWRRAKVDPGWVLYLVLVIAAPVVADSILDLLYALYRA